jgi:hypothetical protein
VEVGGWELLWHVFFSYWHTVTYPDKMKQATGKEKGSKMLQFYRIIIKSNGGSLYFIP